ncbi:gluconokinase [Pseudomonas sp. PIC25]|uniref:gluconokinase, GntK/IdnK-type n=1 Tax=Pseudomonas sp. PIC25 TaxID=1958773 RepID=UPI000BD7EAE0|nr:gluconokinase, GntK/IdnK-type [Pseudomonas sp. PIC25]PAU65422.1 gluconokinase [Pseudomonas sp. PIC25]
MPTVHPARVEEPARRTLVVMGVSGSGKSDVSQAVAAELGWRHIEADHFHPRENVERMRAGIPLGDEDRIHWLDALIVEMQAALAAGEGFVLACSALKRAYRDRLRAAVPGLRFAHLSIDHPTALQRVGARPGHFMPTSLVDSQFATLESPEGEPGVLCVDASQTRQAVVAEVCAWVCHVSVGEAIQARVDFSAQPDDSANHIPGVQPQLTGEPIYSGGMARLFDRLTDGLMAVLMAFMVVVVFGNVVARYAFGTGWAGAEELSRLAFVWLVFVGVASSMRRGELMRFSMIRDRFPHLARRLVDSVSWLLVAVASALSTLGAWNQVQFGWSNSSPVVGYPVVLAMVPVLACMAVLVLLALVQLVNVWRRPEELASPLANVTAD